MIAYRYIARAFTGAFIAALGGTVGLQLLVEFADRAKVYQGRGWLSAVLELYACKFAMAVWQFAPAGLALAGALAVSALRRTGEITALRSLGRGPGVIALPVALCAAIAGGVLTVVEDPVVVRANYRAERIMVERFHRWGDFALYHWDRRWFLGKDNRVYHLGRTLDEGFADVTIFDLTPEFRMARRTDAAKLQPEPDGRWRLVEVTTRTFRDGAPMVEEYEDERVETFKEDLRLFRIKNGRPSQLERGDLPVQIALRQKLGLPWREWEVSLHERRAYQLTGVPAALLGAALALRPRRRGHLTAAIAEGAGVTAALWALNALGRTLALAGHIPPLVGGYAPLLVVSTVAALALRRLR